MLFRKEAIKQQETKLQGSIIIPRSMPMSIIIWFLFLILASLLTFIYYGSYARKETVRGYIVPELGVTKLYANKDGIIENIFITEGQFVKKNQELIRISSGIQLPDGTPAKTSFLKSVNKQIDGLNTRLDLLKTQKIENLKKLHSNLNGLKDSFDSAKKQSRIQNKLLKLSKKQLKITKKLKRKGVLSKISLMKVQENHYRQEEKYEFNNQQLNKIKNEIEHKKISIKNYPSKIANNIAILQSELLERKRERTQLEIQSGRTIRAPVSGYISSISTHFGENIKASKLLISMLPDDAILVAQLFVPTRAIGFVEKNQSVRILLDAFPYQHFGVIKGTIRHVSRTIIMKDEAPIPLEENEPIYKISVTLDNQSINAYGKQHSLQSGMMLSAEVILGKRSLIEWLIEPILSFTRKS